jgi:hypothetical protein
VALGIPACVAIFLQLLTARQAATNENQKANPHGRMTAQGHENAGRGAGSGAGAPPHGLLPEGAGRGIFETKGKNQKARISAPGRGPDWGRIFRGWPQSKQSSMTQFLSGAGNWPPRGIFAARKEMALPRKTRPLFAFCSQNIRRSLFFIAFGGRSGHANRHQFPAFGNWLSVPAFCRLN